MEHEEQTGEYQAHDADTLVGELFSGGITVGEAIERLRARLMLPPYSRPRPSRNKPPGPSMAPGVLVRPAAS